MYYTTVGVGVGGERGGRGEQLSRDAAADDEDELLRIGMLLRRCRGGREGRERGRNGRCAPLTPSDLCVSCARSSQRFPQYRVNVLMRGEWPLGRDILLNKWIFFRFRSLVKIKLNGLRKYLIFAKINCTLFNRLASKIFQAHFTRSTIRDEIQDKKANRNFISHILICTLFF